MNSFFEQSHAANRLSFDSAAGVVANRVSVAKRNWIKTAGLKLDLLPMDFLRAIC